MFHVLTDAGYGLSVEAKMIVKFVFSSGIFYLQVLSG